MPNPLIRIHDLATGEIIDRPMNAAEMKQAEADKLAFDAIAEQVEAKAAAKAALLTKLGITANEAVLLLS